MLTVAVPSYVQDVDAEWPEGRSRQAYAAVIEALESPCSRAELLRVIAEQATKLAGTDRCSLYLREPESDHFRGQVGYPGCDMDDRIKRLVVGGAADDFTREILRTRRPVALTDGRVDPRPVRSAMRAWNVRSMLGVPMVERDKVVGLLFLDSENVVRQFPDGQRRAAFAFASLAALALAQDDRMRGMREKLDAAGRQLRILRHARAIEEHLTGALIAGEGLHGVVSAAAAAAEVPCAIYDRNFARVAVASPDGLGWSTCVCDATAREDERVRAPLEALDGKDAVVLGPFPDLGVGRRNIVAPIRVCGAIEGYVVLIEHRRHLGGLDAHIAHRAAMGAALELAAEARSRPHRADQHRALISALIDGADDEAAVRTNAHNLHFDLAVPRSVVMFAPTDGRSANGPTPGDVERFLGQVAGGATHAIATSDAVVAVVELADAHPRLLRERITEAMRESDISALVGVSRACAAAADYRRAYSDAKRLLACLRTYSEAGVALCTDDIGAAGIFLTSTSRSDAEQFAAATLGPVLSEAPGMRDLLLTLDVFFLMSGRVREVAHILEVHENTVRYRLTRIQRLTGLDVAGAADDQTSAHLATLVARLSGRTAA